MRDIIGKKCECIYFILTRGASKLVNMLQMLRNDEIKSFLPDFCGLCRTGCGCLIVWLSSDDTVYCFHISVESHREVEKQLQANFTCKNSFLLCLRCLLHNPKCDMKMVLDEIIHLGWGNFAPRVCVCAAGGRYGAALPSITGGMRLLDWRATQAAASAPSSAICSQRGGTASLQHSAFDG